MRLVSDLNDDVLLGIAAVFPENVDASDISCAVFDADAQGGKIVAVELEFGQSDHADECLVDIRPHIVDADLFEHAVLRGVGGPVGDGISAPSVPVVAGTSVGAYLFSVDPECDIGLPDIVVIGTFGAQFHGKRKT